jgi:aerobic-type carbon monoxide dehydrogenase small subunit (CoxS/CutS family)
VKTLAAALCLFLTLTVPSNTLANHDTCDNSQCRAIYILINGRSTACVLCGTVASCR